MTGPASPPPTDDEAIQVQGYQRFRAPEGHSGQGNPDQHLPGQHIQPFSRHRDHGRCCPVGVGRTAGASPAPRMAFYVRLAERLAIEGIASLRLDYRLPNDLYECVLDTLAGTTLLLGVGFKRLALVGHSFGGAVVIAAAPYNDKIVAVVGLSSQSAGAQRVSEVAPRPLLLVHGADDAIIPVRASQFIYDLADQPKELRYFQGAGHGLNECREELDELLHGWLRDKLGASN